MASHLEEMTMTQRMLTRTLALGAATLVAAAVALPAQDLNGAGATFPNPIYSKWFDAYHKAANVAINYQSVGSGGGIRQYTDGTVDFGASDGPMTDGQIAAAKGAVIHIPTVMGAVVLTWNVPSLGSTQLKFDGATVADIYLGKITKWNDPRIAALNPGVKLPNEDLIVVHRSDGSGTTYIFTDYLSKISPEWQQKVGKATSVSWPTGLGGKGNEGVTQQVKQVEGAIGYVELIYAVSNKMTYDQLKNAAGKFINPSLESVTAAAASATFEKNTDFRVSITNAPGAAAYPISSFTWLLVRPDMPDARKARSMRDFLAWMVSPPAQAMARDLLYAPLPDKVVGLIKERLKTLKGAGKPIM
jgi:phosphate transport system substrate-binding protein